MDCYIVYPIDHSVNYLINFHEDDTADRSDGYAILLTMVEAKFLNPFFPPCMAFLALTTGGCWVALSTCL